MNDYSVVSVDRIDEEVDDGGLHGCEVEGEFCGCGGGDYACEGCTCAVCVSFLRVAELELLDAAERGEEVVAEVVGAVKRAWVGAVGGEPGVVGGLCEVHGVGGEEQHVDVAVCCVELLSGYE